MYPKDKAYLTATLVNRYTGAVVPDTLIHLEGAVDETTTSDENGNIKVPVLVSLDPYDTVTVRITDEDFFVENVAIQHQD